MILKNKKATKLMSAWWFFVIFVAAGGVVIGVLIVQTNPVDVRGLEASILSEKLVDCFIDNGYLNDNYQTLSLYTDCKLEQKMFENINNYYVKIMVYDESDKELKSFQIGANFEKECDITTKVKGKYNPACVNKTELAIFNDKLYKLNILTASNQEGIKLT